MSSLHDLRLTESKLAEATSTPLGLTKIGWGLLQTQPGDRSSAGGDLTNRPAPRVPRGRRSSLSSPRWSGPPAVSTIKFKKKKMQVCMYACIYACTHVSMHVRMNVCMSARMHHSKLSTNYQPKQNLG